MKSLISRSRQVDNRTVNLAKVVNNAVAKTIVRDKAEWLWQERGELQKSDYDRFIYHPMLQRGDLVPREYFRDLVRYSRNVVELIRTQKPDKIFKRVFGKKSEKLIRLVTRPYGIHLRLCWKDLEKTGDRYKVKSMSDRGFIGHNRGRKYKGVWISVGATTGYTFKELIKKQNKFMKENEEEEKIFEGATGVPFEQVFEIYKKGTKGVELIRDVEEIELAGKVRDIIRDLKDSYEEDKMDVNDLECHELEHSHNAFFLKGKKNPKQKALDELIAYSNHAAPGIESVNEISRESWKKTYEYKFKDAYDSFFDLLLKLHSSEATIKLEDYFHRRVFPMTLLEIGDFDFVKDNFEEIAARVKALDIGLIEEGTPFRSVQGWG